LLTRGWEIRLMEKNFQFSLVGCIYDLALIVDYS